MLRFGTKAETLSGLADLVRCSSVPPLLYFSVEEWRTDAERTVSAIVDAFGGARLAVRSSAYNEDGLRQSFAGAYQSVLDVDGADRNGVRRAVESVIASYHGSSPRDQILVQRMLSLVVLAGVVMTHDLASGAPYYAINYDDESGRTDAVTGGRGVNKTVVVHRNAPARYVASPRVAGCLEMVKELEGLFGGKDPLDVEFAQTSDGTFHLLQVRRIAVQKNWNRNVRTRVSEGLEHLTQFFQEHAQPRPGLAGATTALGHMPDWNPAELIGVHPRPLAVDLYHSLITRSVWQEARATMGYRAVPGESLLVMLAGRPYIDVRCSFNSFLPRDLADDAANALVDAWTDRLVKNPELHDKVEFHVAQTIYDFTFDQSHGARYGDALLASQRLDYSRKMRRLTTENVTTAPDGSLARALRQVEILVDRQRETRDDRSHPLRRHFRLLDDCRQFGTLPFAIVARHAFIAEALLRTAIDRGAWTAERLESFKRSVTTVAGELGNSFRQVVRGAMTRDAFMGVYGHLRPGTFDILSPRYDQRDDLFRDAETAGEAPETRRPFLLTSSERRSFSSLLVEHQFTISPEELLEYAATAIRGREYAKFVFSKHLSDAMEEVAIWGENIGLTRDDLSFLTSEDLREPLCNPPIVEAESHFHDRAEARRTAARTQRSIRLGYILRDLHDFYVVPLHRGMATFISNQTLEGEAVALDAQALKNQSLHGKIVCIESADPGFDFIFTRGIAGLVTKFGGANSHMTIRCAELGLPAAIGVGEQTFERLVSAGRIQMRCSDKVVRPAHGYTDWSDDAS